MKTTSGNTSLDGLAPLPRGRHALSREAVLDDQRRRLLRAVASAVAEHGYVSLTVEHVIREARVSRETFYRIFRDKQDCVRVAHDSAFERLLDSLNGACATPIDDWPGRLAAAVGAAVRFASESPDEARLLLLESIGADPELASRVLASNEHLIRLLRAGRREFPNAALLPEPMERALVGAATTVIGHRILQRQVEDLESIEPQLVQLMLIPYVGRREAQRAAMSPAYSGSDLEPSSS